MRKLTVMLVVTAFVALAGAANAATLGKGSQFFAIQLTEGTADLVNPESFDPGYITTPMRGCGLAMQLDLVGLHQRVREQLLAHALHLSARLGRVGRLHLDVDHLADPCAADREAEVLERGLDGLALRVEDALLRADEDGRLHPSTTDGVSRYCSNGIVVSRSKASMYFERVWATTSSGSSGPGYVLSQPVCSQ